MKPKGWLWGQFTGARGQPLRFGTLRTHATPVAHIVYIEGLSEYAEKTFEIARTFNDHACNFSVFDRHGQGRSPRYLSNPHKQHSTGIDKDIEDIITFCRDHIPAGEPVVLLGHSTGGLLAWHAMQRDPDLFKAAILTAPLFGLQNAAAKGREKYLAQLPAVRILLESYIPGGGGWEARKNSRILKEDHFSGDPVRNKINDYWMENNPALRVGDVTFGWLRAMCRAIMAARDPAFAPRIKQPVLVLTAGKEYLVDTQAALEATGRAPNVLHRHYPDGHHELLLEKESIRGSVFSEIAKFLKNNLR